MRNYSTKSLYYTKIDNKASNLFTTLNVNLIIGIKNLEPNELVE